MHATLVTPSLKNDINLLACLTYRTHAVPDIQNNVNICLLQIIIAILPSENNRLNNRVRLRYHIAK